MAPDEVLALVPAGEKLGCKEALFSPRRRPEALFAEHRAWLAARGHRTTLDYLRERVRAGAAARRRSCRTPTRGSWASDDLAALREVNVSMGIMLETRRERLLRRAAAHDRAPDKVPRAPAHDRSGRRARHPLHHRHPDRHRRDAATSGSTRCSRSASLHERYGHIQEVIIQNFRAKPDIRMRDEPEPDVSTTCCARWRWRGCCWAAT